MRGRVDEDVSEANGGGEEMSDNKSLAESFSKSIKEDSFSCLSEIAEAALDSITNDGFVTNVPLISTVVYLYKIGNSIRERAYLKKLAVFIDAFNRGVVDEEERQLHLQKFCEDKRSRERELEYLVLLIDRYLDINKPQMLAKLYFSYLCSKLTWVELTMYAEVIDRFLPMDYSTLSSDASNYITIKNIGCESILRLVALGLLVETTTFMTQHSNGGFGIGSGDLSRWEKNQRTYKRTEFGEKLVDILK